MATEKKTVKPVAVATKAEAPKTEKVVEKKTEAPAAAVKAEVKPAAKPAAEKKEPAKKAPAKKAAAKPAKKAAAKPAAKPAEKKAAAKPAAKAAEKKAPAKKAELKSEVYVQFQDKSYSQEELMKIAKDVWKYDLKQKAADLTSVELYVKPEESVAYYVMNGKYTGSFGI